jgi:hypothetical protein
MACSGSWFWCYDCPCLMDAIRWCCLGLVIRVQSGRFGWYRSMDMKLYKSIIIRPVKSMVNFLQIAD